MGSSMYRLLHVGVLLPESATVDQSSPSHSMQCCGIESPAIIRIHPSVTSFGKGLTSLPLSSNDNHSLHQCLWVRSSPRLPAPSSSGGNKSLVCRCWYHWGRLRSCMRDIVAMAGVEDATLGR